MNITLGRRIKELRIAKQLTKEQIAESIGISKQEYERFENGSRSITLVFLSDVASALDVTVKDITRVLDEVSNDEYKVDNNNTSVKKISDMLDLFYANKNMYMRLKNE